MAWGVPPPGDPLGVDAAALLSRDATLAGVAPAPHPLAALVLCVELLAQVKLW
jgi:hypothetical protein